MKYYKPKKIVTKPFIVFNAVAMNEADYLERKLDTNKSVITKDQIPKLKFGICEKDIDSNGILIDRNPQDFINAKADFYKAKAKIKYKEIDFNTCHLISDGFEFDGATFSLSSNAQLNWQLIILDVNSNNFKNTLISTKANSTYLLTNDNSIAFVNSYRTSLDTILTNNKNDKKNVLTNIENNLNEIEEYEF